MTSTRDGLKPKFLLIPGQCCHKSCDQTPLSPPCLPCLSLQISLIMTTFAKTYNPLCLLYWWYVMRVGRIVKPTKTELSITQLLLTVFGSLQLMRRYVYLFLEMLLYHKLIWKNTLVMKKWLSPTKKNQVFNSSMKESHCHGGSHLSETIGFTQRIVKER